LEEIAFQPRAEGRQQLSRRHKTAVYFANSHRIFSDRFIVKIIQCFTMLTYMRRPVNGSKCAVMHTVNPGKTVSRNFLKYMFTWFQLMTLPRPANPLASGVSLILTPERR